MQEKGREQNKTKCLKISWCHGAGQSGTAAKTESACFDIVFLALCLDIKGNIKSNLKLSAQSVSDKKKIWSYCVWP